MPGVGQPQKQFLGVVHEGFFLAEVLLDFGDVLCLVGLVLLPGEESAPVLTVDILVGVVLWVGRRYSDILSFSPWREATGTSSLYYSFVINSYDRSYS